MEELQEEMKAVKMRWKKEVELSKAEKGTPGFPFPVAVTRYTPRPDLAHMWDVEELPIRLCINSLERGTLPVSVEASTLYFPEELCTEMESFVEAEWKKSLKASDSGWFLEKTLDFVEANYAELLRKLPKEVETYEGCDDEGATMRRYTVAAPVQEVEEEEEEKETIDEEEQARRVAAWVEREEQRLAKELEDKEAYAEERRKICEAGLDSAAERVKKLSKKEMEALNPSRKEKSGHRWRKTASKANKPVEKEEKKKK